MSGQDRVHEYEPRDAFQPFHNRTQRRAVVLAHRRSGKTVAAVNELVNQATWTNRNDWRGLYLAPERAQAKKLSWDYLKKYARPFTIKVNESELYVELYNGAKIFVNGADRPDALRGSYYDGVVMDEYAQMKREVWNQAIYPSLLDRNGWAVFLGTPKGKSNDFYRIWQLALSKPDKWFTMMLKASESKILDQSILNEEKAQRDKDDYDQEFECSFDAALKGSYYSPHMSLVAQQGRIVPTIAYDPTYPVSLAMDIGRADATAVWFWQIIDGKVRFFDYFEQTGFYAEKLIDKLDLLYGSNYGTWWLPHDANHETFASEKSVIDKFSDYGAPVRRVPQPDAGNRVFHGISAVRSALETFPLYFSEEKCKRGIEALKNYSRKWHADAESFSDTPNHDQYSHGADAFRYAILSISMTEIKNSLEEARSRAIQRERSAQQINTGQSVWTFNDAIADHKRKQAQIRSAGTQRI